MNQDFHYFFQACFNFCSLWRKQRVHDGISCRCFILFWKNAEKKNQIWTLPFCWIGIKTSWRYIKNFICLFQALSYFSAFQGNRESTITKSWTAASSWSSTIESTASSIWQLRTLRISLSLDSSSAVLVTAFHPRWSRTPRTRMMRQEYIGSMCISQLMITCE